MVISRSLALARRAGQARLARLAARARHARHAGGLTADASPLTPHSLPASGGFTILEILIVLFLLGAVVALVIPRIVIGEDLSSTGRKFIGTIRSLQGMATAIQKPVKLYLDIDRGTYWVMVVDGREEKRPLDATWAAPRSLPESIRFTEISVGPAKWIYGRGELSFFPNGRIDPATVYLTDTGNGLLGLAVDPLTGRIRTSDQRFDLTRPRPIPDRVKNLLQAAAR